LCNSIADNHRVADAASKDITFPGNELDRRLGAHNLE
jgi:hypothetical protein